MIDDLESAIKEDKIISVYFDADNPGNSFGIYRDMYEYPKFDRAEMLRRAKRERGVLWKRWLSGGRSKGCGDS